MTLSKQAIALTMMHAADVLQPLLIIPYAGRTLGAEQFGVFAYALGIGAVVSSFVDYGFYWTGQRSASSRRHDPEALSDVFANITCAKLLLLVPILLIGLVCSQALLAMDRVLFLSALTAATGSALFPAWLFIGTEQPWRAAWPVIAARFALFVTFLVLVRGPHDTTIATALQGAAPLLAAILAFPYTARLGARGLRRVSLKTIVSNLRGGSHAFLFALAERIIMTAPLLMVTHLQGYVAAAQYSIAEKFVSATRPIFRVISETFMPRIAYYAKHSPQDGITLICNILNTLALGAALSLGIFLIGPAIIDLLLGPDFSAAIPITRLMALLPLLLNANLVTATLYMFNFGHERAWVSLVIAGLLMFFLAAFLLIFIGLVATMAIPIALIVKELTVLSVSTIFFVKGISRARHGQLAASCLGNDGKIVASAANSNR